MIPLIAVHGHCLGGWCWDPMAAWFVEHGFELQAPTLAAPGDAALAGQVPGAHHHVEQVLSLMREQSQPVILLGSSYGGAIVAAAAAASPTRVRHVVILDGILPLGQQSAMDAFPPLRLLYEAALAASRDGTTLGAPHPSLWGITDTALADGMLPRLRPVHARTCTDRLDCPVNVLRGLKGTLVTGTEAYRAHAEAVIGAVGWEHRRLPVASHLPMLTAPAVLGAALLTVLLPPTALHEYESPQT